MSATATYIYICDRCGTVATITATPITEGDGWECADCGGRALREFTDKDQALNHSRHIMDANHAAEMAKLTRQRWRSSTAHSLAPMSTNQS